LVTKSAAPPAPAPAPASARPDASAPAITTEAAAAPSTPPGLAAAEARSTVSPAEAPALGPLAQTLLQSSRKQIDAIPGTHWFIQLRSTPVRDAAALETFIAAANKYLQADLLQLYVARETPGTQIGVMYGPFVDSASAQRTLDKLPPWLKAHGAFLRRYQSLR
jgi:septal ring-binding cell division protein DamX